MDVPKQEYGQGVLRNGVGACRTASVKTRTLSKKKKKERNILHHSKTLLFIGLTQLPDPEDGGRCS